MKCPKCNNVGFSEKKIRFSPVIKGEEVDVVTPSLVCTSCEHVVMNTAQMNQMRILAADAYKKRHNLLSSSEIIKFREALGMSQTEFSKYLDVGEASIKRWETHHIQDTALDEHIRLKCDSAYAERNALEVYWKNQEPDIYSGNRKFNLEHFKNLVLYLVERAKSPLFLNKALFYADFKHFQKHKKSITGARYVPLEYGPCPDQYRALYDVLIQNNILKTTPGSNEIKRLKEPDVELFDDQERETVKLIYDAIKNDGGKKLYDLSHDEEGFVQSPQLGFISYEFAKSLKLK